MQVDANDAQNERLPRHSTCRIDLRLIAKSDSTSNMDRIIGPNSMLSTTCRRACDVREGKAREANEDIRRSG